jgi:arsenite methyltransferase
MVGAKSDLNIYKQSSYLPQGICCGAIGDFADIDFNEWVGKS